MRTSNPIADAQRDWHERRACYLSRHHFTAATSVIHDTGLYLEVCDDDAYQREYNKEIRRLLGEKGIPDWAPAPRMPSKNQALDLVQNGAIVDTFSAESPPVVRYFRGLIEDYHNSPAWAIERYAVVLELQLLLVGGHAHYGYRVEVFDMIFNVVMGEYDYDWENKLGGR